MALSAVGNPSTSAIRCSHALQEQHGSLPRNPRFRAGENQAGQRGASAALSVALLGAPLGLRARFRNSETRRGKTRHFRSLRVQRKASAEEANAVAVEEDSDEDETYRAAPRMHQLRLPCFKFCLMRGKLAEATPRERQFGIYEPPIRRSSGSRAEPVELPLSQLLGCC